LTNLIDHPGFIHQIRDRLKHELDLVDGDTQCSVVLLQVDPSVEKIKMKFKDRMDLLYYTLVNIANEYLQTHRQGVAFRYLTKEGTVLFLCKPQANLIELVARIGRAIRDTLHVSFDLSIGSQALFSSDLQLSYQSAFYIHDMRNLLSVSFDGVYSSSGIGQAKVYHLLDHQNEFKVALLSGQEKEIEEWVTKFLDRCLSARYLHRKQIQLWEKELELLKEQMLNEQNVGIDIKQQSEEDRSSGLNVWTEDGQFSVEGLRTSFQQKFKQLAKKIRQQQSFKPIDSIYLIKKYVEENSSSNINLQEISDLFFLSREYVSRRFKQEFGINVWDYLTHIRIEKAKLLLQNPALKIIQVAEMIGYNDEKYFSKVFKKMVGQSPNEFRKR
jgi:two-component system response regulator YesN